MSNRPLGFPEVHGHVSPGFDSVREAFAQNFARRRELGGACCAYHRGNKVVDLWGGLRNKLTGELVGARHHGDRRTRRRRVWPP